MWEIWEYFRTRDNTPGDVLYHMEKTGDYLACAGVAIGMAGSVEAMLATKFIDRHPVEVLVEAPGIVAGIGGVGLIGVGVYFILKGAHPE